MARSFLEDPLMTCHFALIEVPAPSLLPIAFVYKTVKTALSSGNFVGFQSMSVPEFTLETKEIKQGNWPYVHNVILGYQSGGNITLTQAVMPLALDMYAWWTSAVQGVLAPRRHMILTHLRADKRLPARMLSCENCIPISWKPASDFDASTSQVSVESLTLWTQRVNIIPGYGTA